MGTPPQHYRFRLRLPDGREYVSGIATAVVPAGGDATPSVLAELGAADFETNKTFLLPSSLPAFRLVLDWCKDHLDLARKTLVIGHADARGTSAHNLGLSQERAQSVAAFLTGEAGVWLGFFSRAPHSTNWGKREEKYMLGEVLSSPLTSREAREELQPYRGGKAMDDVVRRDLIAAYMGLGGDPLLGPIETFGCGEWHPLDPSKNKLNRRVDVLVFESEEIQPPVDDCRSGARGEYRPGAAHCDAYDKWKGKAKRLTEIKGAPDEVRHDLDLEVEVVDSESGSGLDFAKVHASGAREADGVTADGKVLLAGLTPDTYRVQASLDGYDPGETDVEIVAAATPATARIALKRLEVVTWQVDWTCRQMARDFQLKRKGVDQYDIVEFEFGVTVTFRVMRRKAGDPWQVYGEAKIAAVTGPTLRNRMRAANDDLRAFPVSAAEEPRFTHPFELERLIGEPVRVQLMEPAEIEREVYATGGLYPAADVPLRTGVRFRRNLRHGDFVYSLLEPLSAAGDFRGVPHARLSVPANMNWWSRFFEIELVFKRGTEPARWKERDAIEICEEGTYIVIPEDMQSQWAPLKDGSSRQFETVPPRAFNRKEYPEPYLFRYFEQRVRRKE